MNMQFPQHFHSMQKRFVMVRHYEIQFITVSYVVCPKGMALCRSAVQRATCEQWAKCSKPCILISCLLF